jgi:hypothetical protein
MALILLVNLRRRTIQGVNVYVAGYCQFNIMLTLFYVFFSFLKQRHIFLSKNLLICFIILPHVKEQMAKKRNQLRYHI